MKQRANLQRQPYLVCVARCMDCAWIHKSPLVRWKDTRKAAMNHGAATGHNVWIDRPAEE